MNPGATAAAPGAVGVVERHPLTPAQLGLLYDVMSAPEDNLFVERVVCPLHGPLDAAAFVRVWHRLVARHDSLRSGFEWDASGSALQVVWREAPLEVRVSDWSRVALADRSALCEALLADEGVVGFDLARPPLMRLTLARLSPDEHLLIWSSHHLIVDGWSCWVLLGEAALLYLADSHAVALELPPATRFSEYARWLAGRTGVAAARAYWQAYFEGCRPYQPAVPRPGPRRFRHHRAGLPAELAGGVARLGRETRTSLSTLLQAAWALVLGEREGAATEEVLFGAVFSGRSAAFAGAADVVGMLINVLPVRVPLPRSSSIEAWLALLQQRHAEMLDHESCSIHEVRRWVGTEHDGRLFDTVLVVMNVDPLDRLPPLGFSIGRPRYLANAGYPLGVNVTPGPETMIDLLYDLRYFTTAAVEELQWLFAAALAALVDDPRGSLERARDRLRAARRAHVARRRRTAVERLGGFHVPPNPAPRDDPEGGEG
jgi:hypothetical protein